MGWRPWIISSLMIGTTIFNAALLYAEHITPPREAGDAQNEVADKLLDMTFIASERYDNFVEIGMDPDLAKATAEKSRRLSSKTRVAGFKQMLEDGRDEVMPYICANTKLHPRYAALAFLVEEENGQRRTIDPTAVSFEVKEWYGESRAPDVYVQLELVPQRKNDATLMGIAAVLVGEEDKVGREAPFLNNGIMGSGWGWERVDKQYPSAKKKVIDYFSMMHVVAEVANGRDGICE